MKNPHFSLMWFTLLSFFCTWMIALSTKSAAGMSLPSNKADSEGSVPTEPVSSDEDEYDGEDESEHCGLYMAISSTTTPEEPKWGYYAGKNIPANSPIGFGDIAIHTFNLMANQIYMENDQPVDDFDRNPRANLVDWLEQFLWVPHSSGGQFEVAGEGTRIITAVPGGGVLGGYNPKMTNADWNHSSAYHREALNEYPGVSHPGRGAYSSYYNLELASTETIPAGKEIFLNYGENWDGSSNGDGKTDPLTRSDYKKVDQTIEKMMAFFEKYRDDLDDNTKTEIYNFMVQDVMSAAAGKEKGKRIADILPENPDNLGDILERGGSFHLNSPASIRSPEWLKTSGMCMDNIRPGPSTIPYAGRGAFATRAIEKGSTVAPVPLVQIPDDKIFQMHQVKAIQVPAIEKDTDGPIAMLVRDGEETFARQLMYNYVYGHPESSLVFLPVGAVVNFINHSKERVNAKLVWSDHLNSKNTQWFAEDPQKLIDDEHSHLGLLMEIVATKDIAEGDEIFLDYGDDWQVAWDKHVAAFEKIKPETWPITALDLNQEHKTKLIRTKDEQPYPDNVSTKCFLMVKKPKEGEPEVDEQGRRIRVWSEADSGKPNIVSDYLFDCEVISSSETPEGRFYDIVWSNGESTTLVQKVPHKAVVFVDNPGTSDQHFLGFRHYIGIPDEIFPQGPWRNANSDKDEL
ncbi:SET methyltransferase domain containing protein [Nitzschia inconspicua]|uniref:SET methyltransferase domain containing protein n=1 Tax=Nitzschia inconspicua TaxID=303405 RepID=A0A9K3LJ28_9STRA|nr:SET methyltransferase domain containing protein [Nitzschia inconspicua]